MDIDGIGVITLTNPATLELPVDAAMVPFGQRPRLFEWTADGGPLTAASTTDNGRRTTTDNGRRTTTDDGRRTTAVGRPEPDLRPRHRSRHRADLAPRHLCAGDGGDALELLPAGGEYLRAAG
jgi:hypothetical protein